MHEDFRLKVFVTAARLLSFSKAAKELFISQPAVSKHIREVEKQVGSTLFKRRGRQLILTQQGDILLQHAREILRIYNDAEFEINALKNKLKGSFKVGASTTISHYILPSLLAKFSKINPDATLLAIEHNSLRIEELLLSGEIDLGVTEGLTNNPEIKFTPFLEDELILITRKRNNLHDTISLEELRSLPFVFREKGSGTRDVIENHLEKSGIRASELHCRITLSSTESILHFLEETDSFAFLSVHAVSKKIEDKTLKGIRIENFRILRDFYFAQQYGELTGLSQAFFQFCLKNKAMLHNLKL